MQDLLSSNNLMIVGGAVVALTVFWNNPQFTAIRTKLLSFFSRNKPVTPVDVEFSPHDVVDALIKYCQEDKDEAGLQLISTFGKHLYDRQVEKLSLPSLPKARRK